MKLLNITDIDWDIDWADIDEESSNLPDKLIIGLSDSQWAELNIDGGCCLSDLLSDYYGFCINYVTYTEEIPEGIYLPDVDFS